MFAWFLLGGLRVPFYFFVLAVCMCRQPRDPTAALPVVVVLHNWYEETLSPSPMTHRTSKGRHRQRGTNCVTLVLRLLSSCLLPRGGILVFTLLRSSTPRATSGKQLPGTIFL